MRADLVPVESARLKLLELQGQQIGLTQAAKLAGIARSTAQLIRQGHVLVISRDVEQRILSIQRPYLARGQKVPAWRVKRLLRALLGEAYTKVAIARLAHLHRNTLSRDNASVTVQTHLRIERVWRSVSAG